MVKIMMSNFLFLQRMVIQKKRWMWKMLLVIRNYGTASGSDCVFVDKPGVIRGGWCACALSSLELYQPHLPYRQHRSYNGREPGKPPLGVRSVKHNLPSISARHATHRQCREIYNLQCVERGVRQLQNKPTRPQGGGCLWQARERTTIYNHFQVITIKHR